jgi:tetratricopeptide (TPR) repeat protein
MNRRRKRPDWFRIILLSLLVLAGAYIDRYIVAPRPSPFIPTATATRDPESFITEAQALFDQGKLPQSVEMYQRAIAARPTEPAYHVALARAQVFAGQYEDALTSASDALLLDPNHSMAHAVRAWALDFQGEYLEAEAAIKRALELDPNNGLAHAYYVEILVDSYVSGTGPFEGVEKAAEESRVALALAPDSLEALRARGYVLEATANYEEAIQQYQAAANINANISDLHLALGRNYRALGIYDQAVEEFTRANALNPADPTPDLLISRTYATVGEYAKAMQYAETAMNDDPANTNLHGNLGVMYYRNLLWPEAVRELELVAIGGLASTGERIEPINLVPDTRIAEYYFTYGLALARLNRCGEALQVAQMIVARVPSNELAVENAGEIENRCRQNLQATPLLPATPSPTTTPPAPQAQSTPTAR